MRRLQVAVTALFVLSLAAPLAAQTARAQGVVRDTSGRAIRGATVRAMNPEASPREIASTTDNRGRWAMIGLRSGPWTFVVEAPGFAPLEASMAVRTSNSPPLMFTLEPDPSTIPGALDRNIMQQASQAAALREEGRYDQALAAYEQIRARNPKLTSVNLVIGSLYRQRAAQEPDPAARTALLARAIDAYTALLEAEPANARARRELEATRAEAGSTP
jgi:tetratricopeptide (TPR) repeat protein